MFVFWPCLVCWFGLQYMTFGESGWGYEASRFEGVHTLELLLCLQLCMSGGFAGTRVVFPRRSMHSIMPA